MYGNWKTFHVPCCDGESILSIENKLYFRGAKVLNFGTFSFNSNATMMEARKAILDLLLSKSALKQDIFQDTQVVFNRLKKVLTDEATALKADIHDDRIRMQYIDKGEYEAQVFVGSDVLLFHMHTNVFLLPEAHPFWQLEYLKEHPENGYFGIIYIYNFLAQSFIQGRMEDPGYLIGRIFVNKEGHFFIEGKGALGTAFRDVEKSILSEEMLRDVVHTSFAYALDFDLLTPPYEIVSKINVRQIQVMSSSLNMQTGKRLGFKFESEKDEIF